MAGLDSTGLDVKRLNDIIADLETRTKAAFGNSTNVSEDSVFGQLFGVLAPEILSLWELAQGVYDSYIPASAEFTQLDNVAALVGIERIEAANSLVTTRVTGNPGVTIPINSIVSVDGTGDQFQTLVAKTFSIAQAVGVTINVSTVLDSTPYTVTINGVASTHVSGIGATAASIAAGLYAQITFSGEPVTPVDNFDGTLTINSNTDFDTFSTVLSAGLTTISITDIVDMESVLTGPILAPALTLTQITTPVFGWASAVNPVDAIRGRNVETDTELRLRRARSLQISGTATAGAIRSQVAQLEGVVNATIIENDTELPVDGRPPHSFEVIVEGGDDQEIAQRIFDVKPAGIQSVGDLLITVQDSQGQDVVSKFSRPTPIWVHVSVDYTKHNEEQFPVDGETLIANAVLAYGQTLEVGSDVIPQRIIGPIYMSVPGIESLAITIAVSATEFGAPGPFSSSVLDIGSTEVANFNTSRISVTEV